MNPAGGGSVHRTGCLTRILSRPPQTYKAKMIAYICSPYRGDVIKHRRYARDMVSRALKCGVAPFSPHLIYTQCLTENAAGRAAGMAAGLAILKRCDELWVCDRYGVSDGMIKEIEFALDNHKLIRYFTEPDDIIIHAIQYARYTYKQDGRHK